MTRRITSLLAAATLLLVAGCGDSGSGSSGTGADPAKVVPADAAAYIEAAVRPNDDVKNDALDALKKILRSDDPGGMITGAIDKALSEDKTSWDEVKEWLGERAGGFISDVQAGKPVAAAVIDVTDSEKAGEWLKKMTSKKSSPLKTTDYKGTDVTGDGKMAYALLDDYLVIGTATGVQAVIDTKLGRQPLSDVADYNATRSTLKADDALGHAYAQPQRILALLQKVLPALSSSGAPGTEQFASPQFLRLLRGAIGKLGRAAGVSLHANGDAVRIDGAGLGSRTPDDPTAADQVAALPADAWLAFGFKDLGGSLSKAIKQFEQLAQLGGEAVPNLNGVLGQVTGQQDLDFQRDLLSWMGDGAVYARGRSLMDIGAVLTVETKNPAKSRRAVKLIGRTMSQAGSGGVQKAQVPGYDTAIKIRLSEQLPIALFVAANDERFSIGINPQAMSDVLAPSSTFGESETYEKASDSLGGELRPIFVLDFPSVVSLLEGFGLSGNEDYAKVKPYLDAYGTIAVGSAHDGDVARFALAVGLR
jgi:hypothetical protein